MMFGVPIEKHAKYGRLVEVLVIACQRRVEPSLHFFSIASRRLSGHMADGFELISR